MEVLVVDSSADIVGIWGHPEAANLAYLGLHALQHRGQEGAGIVSSDGSRLFSLKGRGLVADVFGDQDHFFGKSPDALVQ